jgi:hypothetical protein
MATKKKGASDKDPVPKKPKASRKKPIGAGVAPEVKDTANSARATMRALAKAKKEDQERAIAGGASEETAAAAAEIARLANIEALKVTAPVEAQVSELDDEEAILQELADKKKGTVLTDEQKEKARSKFLKTGGSATRGGRKAFRNLSEAKKENVRRARERTKQIAEGVKPARSGSARRNAEEAVRGVISDEEGTSTLVTGEEARRRTTAQERANIANNANNRSVRQVPAVSVNVPAGGPVEPVATTAVNKSTGNTVTVPPQVVEAKRKTRRDKAAQLAEDVLPGKTLDKASDDAQQEGYALNDELSDMAGNVATADTASLNFNRSGRSDDGGYTGVKETKLPSAAELKAAGITLSSDELQKLIYGDTSPTASRAELGQAQNFWSRHPIESFFHPDAGNVDALKTAHEQPHLLKSQEESEKAGISPELHAELSAMTPAQRLERYETAQANAPDKNAYDQFLGTVSSAYDRARKGTVGGSVQSLPVADGESDDDGLPSEIPLNPLTHEEATKYAYRQGIAKIKHFQSLGNRGFSTASEAINNLRTAEGGVQRSTKKDAELEADATNLEVGDVLPETTEVVDPRQFEGMNESDIGAMLIGGEGLSTVPAPLNTVLSQQLFRKGSRPTSEADDRPVHVRGSVKEGRSILGSSMSPRLQQQLRDNPNKAQRHLSSIARGALSEGSVVPHDPVTMKAYGESVQGTHYIEDPETGKLVKTTALSGMQTNALGALGSVDYLTEDHPDYNPERDAEHLGNAERPGAYVIRLDPEKAYIEQGEGPNGSSPVSLHRRVTTSPRSREEDVSKVRNTRSAMQGTLNVMGAMFGTGAPKLDFGDEPVGKPTFVGTNQEVHEANVRGWQEETPRRLPTDPERKELKIRNPYERFTEQQMKDHVGQLLGVEDTPAVSRSVTINGVTHQVRGTAQPGRASQIVAENRNIDVTAAAQAAAAKREETGDNTIEAEATTDMSMDDARAAAWSEVHARRDTADAASRAKDVHYDSDLAAYRASQDPFNKDNPGVVAREALSEKATKLSGLSKHVADRTIEHIRNGLTPQQANEHIDDLLSKEHVLNERSEGLTSEHATVIKSLVGQHLSNLLADDDVKAGHVDSEGKPILHANQSPMKYKATDYVAHITGAQKAAASGPRVEREQERGTVGAEALKGVAAAMGAAFGGKAVEINPTPKQANLLMKNDDLEVQGLGKALPEIKKIEGVKTPVSDAPALQKELVNYLRTTLPKKDPLHASTAGTTAEKVYGSDLPVVQRVSFAQFRKPLIAQRDATDTAARVKEGQAPVTSSYEGVPGRVVPTTRSAEAAAPKVMQGTINAMGMMLGGAPMDLELDKPAPTLSSVSGVPESDMSSFPMNKTVKTGKTIIGRGPETVANPNYKPTASEVGQMVNRETPEGPVTNNAQFAMYQRTQQQKQQAVDTVARQLTTTGEIGDAPPPIQGGPRVGGPAPVKPQTLSSQFSR